MHKQIIFFNITSTILKLVNLFVYIFFIHFHCFLLSQFISFFLKNIFVSFSFTSKEKLRFLPFYECVACFRVCVQGKSLKLNFVKIFFVVFFLFLCFLDALCLFIYLFLCWLVFR